MRGEERVIAVHGVLDLGRAAQVRSNWYVGYDSLGVEGAYTLRRGGAGRAQGAWTTRFALHAASS